MTEVLSYSLQCVLTSSARFFRVVRAKLQTSPVMSFLRVALELESLMRAMVAWSSYSCLVSMASPGILYSA